METLFLLLQRYIQTPRVGDVLFRGGILSFYLWVAHWSYQNGAALSASASAQVKNVVYPLLVYAVFGWLMFLICGGFVLAVTGLTVPARGARRIALRGGVYVTKVTAMTFINALILAIRVGFAAITPGNALQTCVEAGTHFLERQADVIIGPQRG